MKKDILLLLVIGSMLSACNDRNPDEIEITDADRARVKTQMDRDLMQPDPLAVAIGMKYDIGADTVLAIVTDYARHHDFSLLVHLSGDKLSKASMDGASEAEMEGALKQIANTKTDSVVQSARTTQWGLAKRFGIVPELVGTVIYDYKAATK